MSDSNVSSPTLVAAMRTAPLTDTVPAYTASPGDFTAGTDSPVSIDSSTSQVPLVTTPSTANRSPVLTNTVSPGLTWSIGTSTCSPLTSTVAIWGRISTSLLTASEDLRRVFASIHLPNATRPMMAVATSKYVVLPAFATSPTTFALPVQICAAVTAAL